jgi:DNA polymerase elongation subunit (family B)
MAESRMIEKGGKFIPCVTLIGRDINRQKRKWTTQYYPYFFVTEKDFISLQTSGYFRGLPIKSTDGAAIRTINKRVLTKVCVSDCGRVKDNIKGITKVNTNRGNKDSSRIYTYEADLSKSDLLGLRYIIDKKIRCAVEISADGKDVKPCKDLGVPVRRWYIDFESYTFKEYTSGISPNDPFIMVSVWDNYEKVMYTFYVNNPKWNIERQVRQCFVPFTEFKHVVMGFKTEAKFLDALMGLVLEKDPDKFLAWNLNRYDAPKWKQRMDLNKDCLYKFSNISPFNSVMSGNRLQIKGRILFDLMVAFKQFTDAELPSYALAAVSSEDSLGYPNITDIWSSFGPEDKEKYKDHKFAKIPFVGTSGQCWDSHPDIVFQRNVIDVLIILALDNKYGITDTYEDLQSEFGLLPQEVLVSNRIIDTALMRMVNGKIALKTTQFEKGEKEEKLLGARVVEPEPDEYKNVVQFDFGAEYPSIIEGFNISPETYREKEPAEPHYRIYYHDEARGDMYFYFIKDPVGLLPQLIKFFKAKRKEYNDEMSLAIANKEPAHVVKKWERRQYNVKKKTNGIYGVMDYPKFRLHRSECTQAVAIVGRISIEELSKFLKSIGYTLLYGDTDSIFVLLHTTNPDEQLEEGKMLQKKLNEYLSEYFTRVYGVQKAPADLGFKKIYNKIMFVGKKNYAGRSIWDEKKGWRVELDIKGIASVRSDASKLERAALEKLITMVLNDDADEIINTYVELVLKDFQDRKYNYMEISYPAQLKKTLKKDKKGDWLSAHKSTMPSHVKAAIYSNMYLNTDYATGDKPRRLSVKFPKLKTKAGQKTLELSTTFPTSWVYKGKLTSKRKGLTHVRENVEFKVTDISVVEDMRIPDFFLANIDYDRIGKRLKAKLMSIVDIHNKVKICKDVQNVESQ